MLYSTHFSLQNSTCTMENMEDDVLLCLCLIIICAAINQIKRENLVGRPWVRRWVSRRSKYGAYYALLSELDSEDPAAFRNFIRMDRDSFNELLHLVTPYIKRKGSFMRNSISPAERLALTLRYLATGDSYKSLQYLYRIPACTISTIVPETCNAIYTVLREKYLKVPESHQEWLTIAKQYEERWNFPNCIGAIDGKHVAIKCPPNSGSEYYNYKHFFSVILLAVVDVDYKFIYIDVGSNGRSNDRGVFCKSTLYTLFENNELNLPTATPLSERNVDIPFVIVGDDAFPLKEYLINLTQTDRWTLHSEFSIIDYQGQDGYLKMHLAY